ncbi:hypothetical protein JST97_32060 [bacterium]|nr:hypothetical protein [bacterium]
MERKQSDLIEEWRRLRDFGLKVHEERNHLARDTRRLHERLERAHRNYAKATNYLALLEEFRCRKLEEMSRLEGPALRQAEVLMEETRLALQLHSLRRDLFSLLSGRIAGILCLNQVWSQMLADLSEHVREALQASLDIMRCYARKENPPSYLMGEWRRALGKLQHPARIYQELQTRRD